MIVNHVEMTRFAVFQRQTPVACFYEMQLTYIRLLQPHGTRNPSNNQDKSKISVSCWSISTVEQSTVSTIKPGRTQSTARSLCTLETSLSTAHIRCTVTVAPEDDAEY